MAKHSIWKSWPKNRTEVTIADGKKTGECVMKWAILLLVVAKRIVVVVSVNEEPIHPPVVILNTPAGVGVIRIRMSTTCEISGQVMRCVRQATWIFENETRLFSVGVANPTEEMIETAIFHHYYYQMIDA